ncbi:hypothetical protein EG240_13975 [Paenimyroides tangerinum]|uniref:Outer membrane protein beta-barrel domain-containing protein n=1 Tax=Paenimyroides tangerinum TaxID=2488728 RepID=A0A3P3W2G8_9FLAO|nr:DUF6646 family protein [Paenimyroides tangerinum]RRJ88106.1 hypothetical protein EG240_13975 [Paenimyroides tangerinum]
MKISKISVLLLSFFGIQTTSYGQMAYDGYGDFKIFTGYTNVGGKSGVDIQFDTALGELVSIGGKINYLIKPNKDLDQDEFGETFTGISRFLDNYDAGLYVRFHFGPTLKIAETMDPYLGADASVKSLGAHAGFKYKLTDVIGLYAQYNYSFSTSFVGSSKVESDDAFINYYGKSNAISVGLTFNLEY